MGKKIFYTGEAELTFQLYNEVQFYFQVMI